MPGGLPSGRLDSNDDEGLERPRDIKVELLLYHYTDKKGWNAIRSQVVWTFRAGQPLAADRPSGAYFTDIGPTRESLRTMHKRLRIPSLKQEFVFQFERADALLQYKGGRGRDRHIYYSPTDYRVEADRQTFEGPTEQLLEDQS